MTPPWLARQAIILAAEDRYPAPTWWPRYRMPSGSPSPAN